VFNEATFRTPGPATAHPHLPGNKIAGGWGGGATNDRHPPLPAGPDEATGQCRAAYLASSCSFVSVCSGSTSMQPSTGQTSMQRGLS
jgi:hypothetical protein